MVYNNSFFNKILVEIMKKILEYSLITLFIFLTSTLIACFIQGNTNVFEWETMVRLLLIFWTIVISALLIAIKEM